MEAAEFAKIFPVWKELTPAQQRSISEHMISRTVTKGQVIQKGGVDCTGLLLVQSGQLRAYIVSDAGRELTIYRLLDLDLCLLSASCLLHSIQFDIIIEAEKDTELWIIPAEIYRQIMEESVPVANYTNEVMAARFSEVMWLMERILWERLDTRVAAFLSEEMSLEGSSRLQLTHETIANHLGTHREVVTRILRYFQSEGIVRLSRGRIEIVDEGKLQALHRLSC